MYILDTNQLKRQVKIYLIASLFCIFFEIIYEYFSHGVYSNFMIYAFTIPLILGAFVQYIFCKVKKAPTKLENEIYNSAVATLTFGSIIEGILQIYGTTNSKVYLYLIVGIVLLIFSLASYLIRK